LLSLAELQKSSLQLHVAGEVISIDSLLGSMTQRSRQRNCVENLGRA
jgi:hypothetical protein